MGKNTDKFCDICLKTMPSNNLKRHLEKHKILVKAEHNNVSKYSIGKERVKKTLMYQQEEFKRKSELGKNIYEII